MSKFRYDYEIIVIQALHCFKYFVLKTSLWNQRESHNIVFPKNTFFNTLGHQYSIRCFYGTKIWCRHLSCMYKYFYGFKTFSSLNKEVTWHNHISIPNCLYFVHIKILKTIISYWLYVLYFYWGPRGINNSI